VDGILSPIYYRHKGEENNFSSSIALFSSLPLGSLPLLPPSAIPSFFNRSWGEWWKQGPSGSIYLQLASQIN
jgi:hypothetical protein